MSMSHNQMAYVAIVSTMIFGSLFVGASGFFQTSEGAGDFDPAAEDDLIGDGSNTGESKDSDGDGLVDAVEAQYGTCLLYTSPSPRDVEESRMPSSA